MSRLLCHKHNYVVRLGGNVYCFCAFCTAMILASTILLLLHQWLDITIPSSPFTVLVFGTPFLVEASGLLDLAHINNNYLRSLSGASYGFLAWAIAFSSNVLSSLTSLTIIMLTTLLRTVARRLM